MKKSKLGNDLLSMVYSSQKCDSTGFTCNSKNIRLGESIKEYTKYNDRLFFKDGEKLVKCVIIFDVDALYNYIREAYYNIIETSFRKPNCYDAFITIENESKTIFNLTYVMKDSGVDMEALSFSPIKHRDQRFDKPLYGIIVTEYIKGTMLNDFFIHFDRVKKGLKEDRPFELDEKLCTLNNEGIMELIYVSLTSTVNNMLKDSIAHGDLHGDNLLVDKDLNVFVIDFEFAGDFKEFIPRAGVFICKKVKTSSEMVLRVFDKNNKIYSTYATYCFNSVKIKDYYVTLDAIIRIQYFTVCLRLRRYVGDAYKNAISDAYIEFMELSKCMKEIEWFC